MFNSLINFCNDNWVPGLIGFFGVIFLLRRHWTGAAPPQTSANFNMGGGVPAAATTPGVKLARYMLAALDLGPDHWKMDGDPTMPTLTCTHPDYKYASVVAGGGRHVFHIDGRPIDANIHEYTQFTTGTPDFLYFSDFEQRSRAICSDLQVRKREDESLALVATITQKDAPTAIGEEVFALFCRALDDTARWATLPSDPWYFHYRDGQVAGLAFRYTRHNRVDILIANKFVTNALTDYHVEILSEKMRAVLALHPNRHASHKAALTALPASLLPPPV